MHQVQTWGKPGAHHHIVWCTRYKLEESPATPPYCVMHQATNLRKAQLHHHIVWCTRYKLKESLVLHHHIVWCTRLQTQGKPSYTTILCDAPGTNSRKAQLHHHIVPDAPGTNSRKAELHHHIVWCTRYKLKESPATLLCGAPGTNSRKAELHHHIVWCTRYKLKESRATTIWWCSSAFKESPATPPYCVMHQATNLRKAELHHHIGDAPATLRKAELHHHIVWAGLSLSLYHQVHQGKPSYTTILCDAPDKLKESRATPPVVWCTRYKLESPATPPYCVMQVQTFPATPP